jgi:hypothetical protein
MSSDLSDFVRFGLCSEITLEGVCRFADSWPSTGSVFRDNSFQVMVEITISAMLKAIGREEKTV